MPLRFFTFALVLSSAAFWSASAHATLTVSPTSVSFGNVSLGEASTSSVTITSAKGNRRNPGQDYNLLAIAIPANSSFKILNNACPAMLTAGSRCTVTVEFRPAFQGPASSELVITARSTAPQTAADTVIYVPLSGSGVITGPVTPGSLEVSPTSLFFLAKCNYELASPQVLLVRNPGDLAVTFQGISLKSRFFTQQSSGCPQSGQPLAGGQSCTITVSYTSFREGTKTADLTVSASSNTVTVGLTGTCTTSFSP